MANNFIISGQTLQTNSNRRNENNLTFSNIQLINMYQQCCMTGVFLINGTQGSVTKMYPIYSSVVNLNYFGAPKNSDDAYLVYPGFGFKLYRDTNYSTSSTPSKLYYNTTSSPITFYTGNGTWNGAKQITIENSSGFYPTNTTASIKIYFQGNEIQITGIS